MDVDGLEAVPINSRIDQICDEFESEWKGGTKPLIEAYCAGCLPGDQEQLLRELLLLELELVARDGGTAVPADYERRFPDARDMIHAVFEEYAEAAAPVAELVS